MTLSPPTVDRAGTGQYQSSVGSCSMTCLIGATKQNVVPMVTKLFINNKWVPSRTGATFGTVNPSTGEEICQVAAAADADVDSAVQAARQAFECGPWRQMHASQRGQLL